MTKTKRTKSETIAYFKWLAREFSRQAVRATDEKEAITAEARAESYELAAFELERNME